MKRWIKEHKFISFLVIAVIAAILFLSIAVATDNGGPLSSLSGTIFGKLGQPFAYVGEKIHSGIAGVFNYDTVESENEQLKDEKAELENELVQSRLSEAELEELRELKAALNFVDNDSSKLVTCRVTSMDNTNWFNVFTIGAGTESGISEGNVVVAGSGLVGKISSCGKGWSKVTTIFDESMNVSFTVSGKSSIMGVIDGSSNDKLTGFTLDSGAAIAEGDTLVTSGKGVYQAGIVIGKVSSVSYDSDTQKKTIVVKSNVDFNSLGKVSVIL